MKLLNYKDFLSEQNYDTFTTDEMKNPLLEKLLMFGKQGRPKYDNVVIMSGGSASGKGFIIENLVGIDGRVFDVDQIKRLALRSTVIRKYILDNYGRDVKELDLKKPDDVSFLHAAISDMGLADKKLDANLGSILGQNKPNLIFDVTMKSLDKLESISWDVTQVGYDKKNIHIVWVVNDIDTAIEQNRERGRSVSENVLKSTHQGVATTIKGLLNQYTSLSDFMDGDFYIVFNKRGVDSFIKKSIKPTLFTPEEIKEFQDKDLKKLGMSGGSYLEDALYIKVKDQGKSMKTIKDLDSTILDKIEEYTKIKFR